jgi:hypothetical protein
MPWNEKSERSRWWCLFEVECLAYPQAIKLFGTKRLRPTCDRVEILPAGKGTRLRHQE